MSTPVLSDPFVVDRLVATTRQGRAALGLVTPCAAVADRREACTRVVPGSRAALKPSFDLAGPEKARAVRTASRDGFSPVCPAMIVHAIRTPRPAQLGPRPGHIKP